MIWLLVGERLEACHHTVMGINHEMGDLTHTEKKRREQNQERMRKHKRGSRDLSASSSMEPAVKKRATSTDVKCKPFSLSLLPCSSTHCSSLPVPGVRLVLAGMEGNVSSISKASGSSRSHGLSSASLSSASGAAIGSSAGEAFRIPLKKCLQKKFTSFTVSSSAVPSLLTLQVPEPPHAGAEQLRRGRGRWLKTFEELVSGQTMTPVEAARRGARHFKRQLTQVGDQRCVQQRMWRDR